MITIRSADMLSQIFLSTSALFSSQLDSPPPLSTPAEYLDRAITHIDGIANEPDEGPSNLLSSFSESLAGSAHLALSLFRSTERGWTPPRDFLKKLSESIKIIKTASQEPNPSVELQEKIKAATQSLFDGLARLNKLPTKESNRQIQQGISRLTLALGMGPDPIELEGFLLVDPSKKEMNTAALEKLTGIFGENEFPVVENFLSMDGAAQILEEAIKASQDIKAENKKNLREHKILENENHVIRSADCVGSFACAEDPRSLIAIANTLFGLGMPLNAQINTDGFMLGIVNLGSAPEVEASAPLSRAIKRKIDSAGYGERSSYLLKDRSLWLNVSPSNVLQQEIPFISGTRQLSFKLNNGARREASAHLDLSPLSPLSFAESCAALSFIREMGTVYSEPELLSLAEESSRQPLGIAQLREDLVEKLLRFKNPSACELKELSKDQAALLDIALKFNAELTINIYQALYTLSPDTHASCIDHLEHIYQGEWENHREIFEGFFNDKKGVEFAHDFLQVYDKIQFLLSFHGREKEENHQKINDLRVSANEMLGDPFLLEEEKLIFSALLNRLIS